MQLLKQVFSDSFPSQSGRYPVAVVMITVPPTDIDVNLEPNKTSVLLQNMVSYPTLKLVDLGVIIITILCIHHVVITTVKYCVT